MNENVSSASTMDSEADNILQKENFGTALKQAREEAGLSLQEIASRLLISIDIIKAIENSQSEQLPAATFTQGYIRSYAKLVGVSADRVIEAYLGAIPDDKKVSTPHAILPDSKRSGLNLIKNFVLVIAFLAVFAGFYWMYNNLNTQQLMHSLDMPDALLIDQERESSVELTESADVLTRITIQDEVDDITDIESTAQLNDLPEQAGLNETNQSIDSDTTVTIADETAVTYTETAQIDSTVVKDTLYLHAGDSSWCEINDKDDNRLVYRLVNVDETLEIQAEAPFHVYLGNAHNITMHINNQEVNFSHLIGSRSRTASLKINTDASVERYRRP